MAGNGNLPSSSLAPIYQGRLRKDAAGAWNAMNAESVRRYGVRLRPLGGMSAYRTYQQQVYLYRTVRPGWAARPGTSNHGWGLAIDIASPQMRKIVDAIGSKYGWAKRWSDASWEWWHLKWRAGIYHGRPAKPRDPYAGLGPKQRKAAKHLQHHRRAMAKEKRSGQGPKFHYHLRWARWWKRRVQGYWRSAKGSQRRTLERVIKATDGR